MVKRFATSHVVGDYSREVGLPGRGPAGRAWRVFLSHSLIHKFVIFPPYSFKNLLSYMGHVTDLATSKTKCRQNIS